ncbi:MAG TPA: LIC12192 family sporadic carbohydrate cluster protein [Hypericibacter adhaerens]|jgi:sporadic carbohydrate cluster protein (TIGR04323 family)|uniref:LIC12192 family sporadic carbohydrate cluster protein n=1 Tax=Hypericibacter adhaerens TaxID=2602016 RepID=UPI002B787E29|nr:LIC12192 family sporadic carbohydrate cluster protein [Hypericibacter adhaerens]HWA44564.1 LIC12192 family sporadic carbohydrate cluster protein [Hypericibacter adhaerens]
MTVPGARFGYRGYVASRPILGSRAPQHVQNLVLRDYCSQRGLHYLLSATEYVYPSCYLMLEQALDELPKIEGIVAYSLFMLPRARARRAAIFARVLESGGTMHFAVEQLSCATPADVARLEDIFRVQYAIVDQPPAALVAGRP